MMQNKFSKGSLLTSTRPLRFSDPIYHGTNGPTLCMDGGEELRRKSLTTKVNRICLIGHDFHE